MSSPVAGGLVAAHSPAKQATSDDDGALPCYTRAEVAKHADPFSAAGCWIVIENFVYDVSKFIMEVSTGHQYLCNVQLAHA